MNILIYQKLLVTPRKKENDPKLKTTALNLNHKLFEKVAYVKAFPSKVWSLQAKPKETLGGEPANTRTAGIDTNHSTMLTLLLELNVICGQRWTQFELQKSLMRAFAIDGKMYTAI